MKRRLFTILSALSLLLFVALVVLWVRSHSIADQLQRTHRRMEATNYAQRHFTVVSSHGGVVLSLVLSRTSRTLARHELVEQYGGSGKSEWSLTRLEPYALGRPEKRRLGFDYLALDYGSRAARLDRARELIVPYWSLAVASAVLPCLWTFRRLRTVRSEGNPCPACGYDLRATPGRCPECGAVPSDGGVTGGDRAGPAPAPKRGVQT